MVKRRLRHLRAAIRRLALPRGWLRRFLLRVAWAGLAGLMVYFVFKFVSTSLELNRLDSQISQRQADNTAIALQNQQLQGELDYVKSDAYIERAARDLLGMAREGETVVVPNIIAREPTAVSAPTPSPVTTHEVSPNWKRWVNAIRGEH